MYYIDLVFGHTVLIYETQWVNIRLKKSVDIFKYYKQKSNMAFLDVKCWTTERIKCFYMNDNK